MRSDSVPANPERIRVLHLVTSLNVGGLERVVLDLVRHQDQQQFELAVVCLDEAGDLLPEFEAAGVTPVSLRITKSSLPVRVWRLTSLLRRWNPHVLHTHNSAPHFVGALASQLARVPVLVHTKHGRNYVDRPKAVFCNRIASRLSSCIVPVSRDAEDVAKQVEKVPARLLKVIHNGIDLTYFSQPPKTANDGRRIGRAIHVARLNPVKDQTTLLRAARIAADAQPDFILDIVGDGPARPALESLWRELRLEKHVNLLGMRSDVPELLQSADYFVLSSISEGVSLTLLEAMASELAIVATDVGGNREVVEPGATGLLVPARDPQSLADAMLQMSNDVRLCRQWGAAGRQRVTANFDVVRAAEAYHNLYLDLLSRTRRSKQPQIVGSQYHDGTIKVSEYRVG